ncbi:MAG: sugar transferase, partial [Chitinophagaceae bacterium]
MNAKKMHFEISERKLLLRIFDILGVFGMLFLVEKISQFDYFVISGQLFWPGIVLATYLMIIGSVFEMYNLQVSSSQFQIIRSILLTGSVTVLIYLLTPVYTPILPQNRIQILYFYLSVIGGLFVWRMLYLRLLASQRFLKKAVLICDNSQLKELVEGLSKAYTHYNIIGYVNTDSQITPVVMDGVREIPAIDLSGFVSANSVSEIVVASQKTDGITANLYNQLIHMLEGGRIIREYTQVYEELTQRIPVQFVSRDFYRYFPFSRSNQNHLYRVVIRILEILFSIIGISIGTLLLPFIVIGNLLGNRG